MFCDDLEGWAGVEVEREFKTGDMNILRADSPCCMEETYPTL